jgi:predicted nucleotidyltransferase
MDLPALVAGSAVPDDVRAAVEELVRHKSATREMGAIAVPDVLTGFVEAELRLAEAALSEPRPAWESRENAWSLADDAFRRLVDRRQPVG